MGHRYDQIQGRPLMLRVQTKLDHVLLHKTGGQLIPSLLQLTFPLKVNITRLPTACLLKKKTRVCVNVLLFPDNLSSYTVGRIYILAYSVSWVLIPTSHLSGSECMAQIGSDLIDYHLLCFLQLHFLQHN